MHNFEFFVIGAVSGGAMGFAFYTKAASEMKALKHAVKDELGYLEAQIRQDASALANRVKQSLTALRRLL